MAFDSNPLVTTFAGKVAVREYVDGKVGREILSTELGVHTSLDWDAVVRLSSQWMRQTYYWRLGKYPEWAYKNIPPRLLVEEVLIAERALPKDYRFYMVGGVCHLIQVDTPQFGTRGRDLYTPEWERLTHLPDVATSWASATEA
jgi:hypothetical protein